MYGAVHYAEPATYGYHHSVEPAVNYTSYPSAAIPVQDHQECGTDYFPPPLTQVPIPPLNLIPCPAASSEFLQYSGRADYPSADHPHHHEHREHRVEHVSGDRARLHIHVSSGPPASSSHTRTRKVTRYWLLLYLPRFLYPTNLGRHKGHPLSLRATSVGEGRSVCPFYARQ